MMQGMIIFKKKVQIFQAEFYFDGYKTNFELHILNFDL